jgi:hypothetical protein
MKATSDVTEESISTKKSPGSCLPGLLRLSQINRYLPVALSAEREEHGVLILQLVHS